MQNLTDKELKIAVDIGTTTVELAIIDSDGNIISTDNFKNPQSKYGRDVINRIYTATRDKSFIKTMKDLIISALKDSIINILSNNNINCQSIKAMCICGNTTMISILMEYDLEELGIYPFKHKLTKSVISTTRHLFYDNFPFDCKLILSGCASAFIGGDALAGLISINSESNLEHKKSYLFLDLGTNGEMIMLHNGIYYCASTACGPAFEACSRCNNIYGNTIIDAICLGIKTGKISQEGILADSYLECGIDILGVNITPELLRDILLAKAAIRTGIDILLSKANTDPSIIDRIYVAGGFGFHLNIDNVIFIGLIPKEFSNSVYTVGNTSLKGAIEVLMNENNLTAIDTFMDNDVKLIQMANIPDYQDMLVNNMYFK